MSLNDRQPGGMESMGDCAGVAVRLADIHEAATAWNGEISKLTLLSNRGVKRRAEETEGGAQQLVDLEKVHRLAKHPVLKKVRKRARFYCAVFVD